MSIYIVPITDDNIENLIIPSTIAEPNSGTTNNMYTQRRKGHHHDILLAKRFH